MGQSCFLKHYRVITRLIDRFGPRPKTTKLGKRHDFRHPRKQNHGFDYEIANTCSSGGARETSESSGSMQGPPTPRQGRQTWHGPTTATTTMCGAVVHKLFPTFGRAIFMSTYVVARALALPNVDIMACLGLVQQCSATDFLTRGSCLLPFAFAPGRFPLSFHFHINEA